VKEAACATRLLPQAVLYHTAESKQVSAVRVSGWINHSTIADGNIEPTRLRRWY